LPFGRLDGFSPHVTPSKPDMLKSNKLTSGAPTRSYYASGNFNPYTSAWIIKLLIVKPIWKAMASQHPYGLGYSE